MRKINVLLAIRPRLLSAVVSHLVQRQPDMAVVGERKDSMELESTIKATAAEVVILTPADAGGEPELCRQLWTESPHLKIIILSANGDTALSHAAGAPQKRIEDVSEAALLSAIREFRW